MIRRVRAHTRARAASAQGDVGAALILAIGFIVLISAIVGGLAALIVSSFLNRTTLEHARDREYAADAAIQDAITNIRQVTDRSQPIATVCNGYSTSLNNATVRVDCYDAVGVTSAPDNLVVSQRNVILLSCLDTGAACSDSTVIIRAQVNFEQLYSGAISKTVIQSWSVNR